MQIYFPLADELVIPWYTQISSNISIHLFSNDIAFLVRDTAGVLAYLVHATDPCALS